MPLLASQSVARKLREKHGVSVEEVKQCFLNRTRGILRDTREVHRTHPPTMWFIASTDAGRELKIVFVLEGNKVSLKRAYSPNDMEKQIYATKAQ
jgi:uncharacterized DUF497 family protein